MKILPYAFMCTLSIKQYTRKLFHLELGTMSFGNKHEAYSSKIRSASTYKILR